MTENHQNQMEIKPIGLCVVCQVSAYKNCCDEHDEPICLKHYAERHRATSGASILKAIQLEGQDPPLPTPEEKAKQIKEKDAATKRKEFETFNPEVCPSCKSTDITPMIKKEGLHIPYEIRCNSCKHKF